MYHNGQTDSCEISFGKNSFVEYTSVCVCDGDLNWVFTHYNLTLYTRSRTEPSWICPRSSARLRCPSKGEIVKKRVQYS